MARRMLAVHPGWNITDLFGGLNANVDAVERILDVAIEMNEGGIQIEGEEEPAEKAQAVMTRLIEVYEKGNAVTVQLATYLAEAAREGVMQDVEGYSADYVCITPKGRPIVSKTLGQKQYIKAIQDNDITFAIGPAGTGKTFLAVAMAVNAFRSRQVARIILTRPAVEAGEKLGFLPGDFQSKVDPYMRPLYDALHELMGTESYLSNVEKGLIEVSPLAYMRGRTLDNAFIILDEAQNTTSEQMKMFLTRLGYQSRAVVTGDITQVDIPRDKKSGLKECRRILRGIDGLAFIELTRRDIVRNGLVQKIIRAYEHHPNGRA